MRAEFLKQLEQALPAIMAPAKVEEMEIPALAQARDSAVSPMGQHRRFRQGVARNTRAARADRNLINILRRLDALYLSFTRDEQGTALAEAGDEVLRRLLPALDAVIDERDTNNQAILPMIAQFSTAMMPVVKTLRKVPVASARLVAGDARDLMNSMIVAYEASRDLVLALRVLRMRLEVELTGVGEPANSVAELRDFLANAWG
jgi:hypothetical protein